MPMSKEEMLARIQAGARNQNEPELSPEAVKIIQQHLAENGLMGWNQRVAPPKPDPEAAANAQIEAATPALKPGNPMAGQPSMIPSSLRPGQPLPEMPDNPTDDDQSKMNKLMWLKQQSGQ